MIIFKKIAALQDTLNRQREMGMIGFVPTMGALHQGHLQLIEASNRDNHITVASIFINPLQFNDPKDFQKYPVTLEKDIESLIKAGCNILFLPSQEEVYPAGINENEHFDLGMLDQVFEGKFRPGHFQGVCQVVNRLLDIVKPVNLYMGQKDYQQCMVIKKLLVITGRDTKLQICETVREPGGLAMSSRNMRLSEEEKISARAIFNALQYCQQHFKTDNLARVEHEAKDILTQNGFRIDYLEFAHALDLQPIDKWKGEPVVVLVAAFLNDVRLIDNKVMAV